METYGYSNKSLLDLVKRYTIPKPYASNEYGAWISLETTHDLNMPLFNL